MDIKHDSQEETMIEKNDSLDNHLQGQCDQRGTNVDSGMPSVKEINLKNTVLTDASDGLSKKQRKRMQRREKWLEVRKIKRAKEKERLKQKKVIALKNNIKLGPSRKELKYNKMSNSKCKVKIVVDLSFNDLMNDKDIGKCVKQIHHCYSVNRKFPDPMQFYLTSFGGRLEEDMKKHDGYQNWDINFSSEHFTKIFEQDKLVYLTSESENTLTHLEDDKVYIIGGLVDHNSQKGLCHRLATEAGISHGQLPIGEILQMASRKTLTIDHVFEIMHGVCHGKTWEEALLQVIPARKGAQVKKKDSELTENEEESNNKESDKGKEDKSEDLRDKMDCDAESNTEKSEAIVSEANCCENDEKNVT